MQFRPNSRRGIDGRPVVVDSNGQIVGQGQSYRNIGAASQASAVLTQTAMFWRSATSDQLNDLATNTCQRLFGHGDFGTLKFPALNELMLAIRRELRHRN